LFIGRSLTIQSLVYSVKIEVTHASDVTGWLPLAPMYHRSLLLCPPAAACWEVV